MSLLALPLTAVLTLHLSPGGMGLLTAAGCAPHLLFSLLAGGWIDRSLRRRLIMITADVGRAVVVASVPLAVALGVLSPAHLYLVAFLAGTLTVLFDQSATSLLVLLTRPEELLAANGHLSTSQAAAQVAGPSLGGLLVGAVGAPLALLADAVSFLASGALLAGIAVSEPRVARDGTPPAWRAIGVRPTLWVAAVGGLLCVAWLLPSPIRRVRTPPAQAT